MKLSIGIVGLPNVGKSTLFNILTRQEVNAANYPFATIDPNVGIVPVPDERLDKLSAMSKSAQTIPAVVEFYDIAGLVRGASKGEGLGNQFLNHIKEVNAILHVVRCFSGGEVVHVEGTTNPVRDIDTIESELILKDLEAVEKNMERVSGEARSGDKEAKRRLELLTKAKGILESERVLSSYREFAQERLFRELGLLTTKPQLFLLNGAESDITPVLVDKIKSFGNPYYIVADLGRATEIPAVIREAYRILGLVSYFTTGEKESRAWTVQSGSNAKEAAGAIHSDFEEHFIRAEVIHWDKLLEAGSWAAARSRGLIRTEGKLYIVEDGDVMIFKV